MSEYTIYDQSNERFVQPGFRELEQALLKRVVDTRQEMRVAVYKVFRNGIDVVDVEPAEAFSIQCKLMEIIGDRTVGCQIKIETDIMSQPCKIFSWMKMEFWDKDSPKVIKELDQFLDKQGFECTYRDK